MYVGMATKKYANKVGIIQGQRIGSKSILEDLMSWVACLPDPPKGNNLYSFLPKLKILGRTLVGS